MQLAEGVPTDEGRKRVTPPIRRYFTAIGSSNVKMVADRHRHASDKLLINVNIDNLEWPWIPQNKGF